MNFARNAYLISLLLAAQSISYAASAQQASSPATETAPISGGNAIEEVVVTATRREESIEKVPISLKALTAADLNSSSVKSIGDLASITPGLQFSSPIAFSSGLTTISIRGMNTGTGPSVVGIYVDDTPVQTRLSPNGNVGNVYPLFFDLDRVEVARGPQGTLFGAGSEAGNIRFIGSAPSLINFDGLIHGEAAVTDGGAPSVEAGGALGGPVVNDQVGIRVSAWYRSDGGYIDRINPITGRAVKNNSNRNVSTADRGALTVKLNDDIFLTGSVNYQYSHSYDTGRFYGAYSNADMGVFRNGRLLANDSTDRFILPSIKLAAHLPFAELTSVSSYFRRDANAYLDASAIIGAVGVLGPAGYGNPLGPAYPSSLSDVAPTQTGQVVDAFTQEVRLASNSAGSLLSWVAGIFYDHRRQRDYQVTYSQDIDPTGANVLSLNQQVTDNQVAVFAQGDLHFTDKLTATAGLRVANISSRTLTRVGAGLFNFGEPPVSYGSETETPITPRVALSYQADADSLFYASASKGFRAGGGNSEVPNYCDTTTPSTYKSDSVWSYEIGAKNRLLDGRIQADASAFLVDWSNIQQIIYFQCGFGYVGNAGGATIKGFDLSVQALVTDHLKIRADVGYADAYFSSKVYDAAGDLVIRKGDKVGLLPQVNSPWNVIASAEYTQPLRNSAVIYFRAEQQYSSRNPGPFISQIPSSPSYYPGLRPDPATNLTKMRLGARLGENLDISVYANNVFNKRPLLALTQDSATSNLYTYSTFRPRTVGLSVSNRF